MTVLAPLNSIDARYIKLAQRVAAERRQIAEAKAALDSARQRRIAARRDKSYAMMLRRAARASARRAAAGDPNPHTFLNVDDFLNHSYE